LNAAAQHLLAGAAAEKRAADYLQQAGLTLLARNYRCRFGEIDLIMQDGASLVFVEVRLRQRSDFGGAAASIDQRKQAKLIRTAQVYLASLRTLPPCRFDALLLNDDEISWVKNAFDG
jgi:putative endonuclease